MSELENQNSIILSAQKLEREIRRSLNTFQGYIHALEEDAMTEKQRSFVHKLEYESDRMTRKLSVFGKIFNDDLDVNDGDSSIFKTKETFEALISMLRVDFPHASFKLKIDPKIQGRNRGNSSHVTDMIYGIAVLLLQHQSTQLTINLQLSQLIEDNQFIDISLETNHCSFNETDLANFVGKTFTDGFNNNSFVSSLSLELSRKLLKMKGIEPKIEVFDHDKLRIVLYDQWTSYSETSASYSPPTARKNIDKLHILIVEDDKLNQLVTEMMIKNFGWTCDIANDGIEALEMFDSSMHNCVLMDIEMPRMNGYECTKELRKRYGNSTPIIALSAHTYAGNSDTFTTKGLTDYLIKPVKKDMLFSKIKHAMEFNHS